MAANTIAGINKGVSALQDTAKKTARRIAKKAAKERRENCKKDFYDAEKKKCEAEKAKALEKTTTIVTSSDDDKKDEEKKCPGSTAEQLADVAKGLTEAANAVKSNSSSDDWERNIQTISDGIEIHQKVSLS